MDVSIGRRCNCEVRASLPWLFLILIRIKFTNLTGFAEAGFAKRPSIDLDDTAFLLRAPR